MCPFSGTNELGQEEEGGHFLNPSPQPQHPDQNQEGFGEPERRTDRQTDGKCPGENHFFLESEASAEEWGWLLCGNALPPPPQQRGVRSVESRKEKGRR